MWLFTYSGLFSVCFFFQNSFEASVSLGEPLILHALIAMSALLLFLQLCGLRSNQELVSHLASEKWAFPGASSSFETL